MSIFLDTGFFTALCHPKDEHHERSIAIMRKLATGNYGLIYTSSFVISETATLLLIRTENNHQLLEEFFQLMFGSKQFCKILHSTPEIDKQIYQQFQKFNQNLRKKSHFKSFVDVSNIVFCQNNKIENIVAFDSHFEGHLTLIE